MEHALRAGYRHIDAAHCYGNEKVILEERTMLKFNSQMIDGTAVCVGCRKLCILCNKLRTFNCFISQMLCN